MLDLFKESNLNMSNPLRDVTVMELIEFTQMPLKMFKVFTKDEHGENINWIVSFVCNQLQEASIFSTYIEEFEELFTHQMSRVERNSGRRMIRQSPRIIKMNID